MITTIPWPTANRRRAGRNTAGFTLVEVMVAATISIFVLTGIITAALFIGRSAANIRNYTDMETQGRKMLEYFAEDTRQASAVTWAIGGNSVTLVVNTVNVTYAYSPTALTLTRTLAGSPNVSVSNVNSFQFLAYTINGTQITNFTAQAQCQLMGFQGVTKSTCSTSRPKGWFDPSVSGWML